MREFDGDKGAYLGLSWHYYRKTQLTKAARVPGPFTVETLEGTMECPDGYIALDAEGNPYPIAKSVFEATYERAGLTS
jgi:hypothetical protein